MLTCHQPMAERDQGRLPIVPAMSGASIGAMKATPRPGTSQHRESKPATALRSCNIVTLYEDFPAAIRAHRSFDRVTRALGGNLPVHATSWSFAMLGTPQLKATIARDSASAHAIVVAARGSRELPTHVAKWVENCINHNHGDNTVLVALHEDDLEAGAQPSPLCKSIERIADRTGVSFRCTKDFEKSALQGSRETATFETPRNPIRVVGNEPHPAAIVQRRRGIHD